MASSNSKSKGTNIIKSKIKAMFNSSSNGSEKVGTNNPIVGGIPKGSEEYEGLTKHEIIELMEADRRVTDRSIRDLRTWAKVVYVYDGDTCHIVIKYQGELTRLKCRVYGIDTPEIRTKNAEEKECAIQARDRFVEMTNDRLVWVNILNNDDDKYGRYIVKFYLDSKEVDAIDRILIEENHGYAYYGGTKEDFNDWNT